MQKRVKYKVLVARPWLNMSIENLVIMSPVSVAYDSFFLYQKKRKRDPKTSRNA